jgi:hypothetical protein
VAHTIIVERMSRFIVLLNLHSGLVSEPMFKVLGKKAIDLMR